MEQKDIPALINLTEDFQTQVRDSMIQKIDSKDNILNFSEVILAPHGVDLDQRVYYKFSLNGKQYDGNFAMSHINIYEDKKVAIDAITDIIFQTITKNFIESNINFFTELLKGPGVIPPNKIY